MLAGIMLGILFPRRGRLPVFCRWLICGYRGMRSRSRIMPRWNALRVLFRSGHGLLFQVLRGFCRRAGLSYVVLFRWRISLPLLLAWVMRCLLLMGVILGRFLRLKTRRR